jgi:hypothetical protein
MRPIDADALIEKCGGWYVEEGTESGFIGTLKNLLATEPTIQPQSTAGQLNDSAQSTNLIDRQQAIDAVRASYDEILDFKSTGRTVADSVEDIISELPSVQPEPQWILCDERMPEEHEWLGTKKFGTTISDEVYVTFENEKGERFCKHMSFQNGKLSGYDQFHMDTWFKGSKPIAWMPLPEAYKPNK